MRPALQISDFPPYHSSTASLADAYPPLMLLKRLLLQKWYLTDSDPELENQVNDRISFKKFMGLSFAQRAPDHTTFPRFRVLKALRETQVWRQTRAVITVTPTLPDGSGISQ